MTGPVGLFVGYASCHEERRYCENPAAIGDLILRSSNPKVQDAVREAEERLRLSFHEELVVGALLDKATHPTGIKGRSVQRALHVAACELLAERVEFAYLAGYSSGYGVAYVVARAIRLAQLDRDILRAVRPHIQANLQAWESGGLASFLVYQRDDPTAYRYTMSAIADRYHDLRLKDDRTPHGAQIVGPRASVERLRSEIVAHYPSAGDTTTPLIKSDSAHMQPDAFDEIREQLGSIQYGPTLLPIIGHVADLPQNTHEANRHGGFLFDCFVGHLSMGRVAACVKQIGNPILAVSSPRVARFAFYSLATTLGGISIIHWEDALLSSYPKPLPLADRVPAW